MGEKSSYFEPEMGASKVQSVITNTQNINAHKSRNTKDIPSLRPPTLMIDLLFGALMLFALHMGNPNSQEVVSKEFNLPTNNENADRKDQKLAALKPIRSAKGKWLYKISGGRQLTPKEVKVWAKNEGKTPVIVVTKSVSVQSYLDAEEPLRMLGLNVGLAVEHESEVKK